MNIDINGFFTFSENSNISTIEIAQKIGKVIESEYFHTVQILTPKRMEQEYKNSYSGNYGLNEFPFHTDMAHWHIPPRYLLLKCVNPAKNTYTTLMNLDEILQEIDFNYHFAHFTPRKNLNSQTTILHLYNNGICRWDKLFLKPFNKYAKDLELIIHQKIQNSDCKKIHLENSGDFLLIDNWKMIHGRSSIDEKSLTRCYERIYLSEIF